MSDGIIDIRRYLNEGAGGDETPGTFALWGAEGERSRFALPLWRIVFLAKGQRGAILSRDAERGGPVRPLVVLDLARDPARMDFDPGVDGSNGKEGSARLDDLGADGVAVHLGVHRDRSWCVRVRVDGDGGGRGPLSQSVREDILFLSGECAGLLFLRDLADDLD